MVIDFVLFDLYGTLVDIEVDESDPNLWTALAHSLRRRGYTTEAPSLQRSFATSLNELRQSNPDEHVLEGVFIRVLESLKGMPTEGELRDFGECFRRLSTKRLELRIYTEPLIDALRRSGCKIGLVSNTEAILTRYDLSQFPILNPDKLDVLVLSSEAHAMKPSQEIFKIAIERTGSTAERGVFIGDSYREDITGALGVGLEAVWINNSGARVDIPATDQVAVALPNLESITAALKTRGWQP